MTVFLWLLGPSVPLASPVFERVLVLPNPGHDQVQKGGQESACDNQDHTKVHCDPLLVCILEYSDGGASCKDSNPVNEHSICHVSFFSMDSWSFLIAVFILRSSRTSRSGMDKMSRASLCLSESFLITWESDWMQSESCSWPALGGMRTRAQGPFDRLEQESCISFASVKSLNLKRGGNL